MRNVGALLVLMACSCTGVGVSPATGPRDAAAPVPLDAWAPDGLLSIDAEPGDAARDGGPRDAGTPDAGRDASTDAGPVDAGPPGLLRGLRAAICGPEGAPPGRPEREGGLETVAEMGPGAVGPQAFSFLEGPVWLTDRGVLRFSDFNRGDALDGDNLGPPSIIWELRPPESIVVFSPAGAVRSNGLAVDEAGQLVAAAHDRREIARVDASSSARTTLADRFDGLRFNAPNDLVVASNGTVYFTDPAYNGQLDGRAQELAHEGVYRLTAAGALSLVDGTLGRPNGITLSPDERWLYVATRADDVLYRYPLDAMGVPGARETFREGESNDGVAVDCAGNLYLARPGRGVAVVAPDGTFLFQISARQVTNVAFGGSDHRTLYVTERTRLRAVRMSIAGLPY